MSDPIILLTDFSFSFLGCDSWESEKEVPEEPKFNLSDVLKSYYLRKLEFIFFWKYLFKFDKRGTAEMRYYFVLIFLNSWLHKNTYPLGLNLTTVNCSIHSVPCPHKVFLLKTGNKILSHYFPKSQKMLILIFCCHVVTEHKSLDN